MDQCKILCFNNVLSFELLKKQQNLTDDKIKELDNMLNKLVNDKNVKWLDIQEFNRISGLHVDFMVRGKFYTIELTFNGSKVYFEARYRLFNHDKYDSDDEDEKDKLTSFHFVPFCQLLPIKLTDGTNKLTIDMYLDFVYECLTMRPEDHQYRYS